MHTFSLKYPCFFNTGDCVLCQSNISWACFYLDVGVCLVQTKSTGAHEFLWDLEFPSKFHHLRNDNLSCIEFWYLYTYIILATGLFWQKPYLHLTIKLCLSNSYFCIFRPRYFLLLFLVFLFYWVTQFKSTWLVFRWVICTTSWKTCFLTSREDFEYLELLDFCKLVDTLERSVMNN
jgi:hypothetical protein